ncbi:MAG TPA: lipocalin-like domain-containing protein, partial [Bryobacteraceae bacterium]|nr:lipocalin-like domain-containing protein [Bryobacteraceae bacterium]
MTHVLRPLLLFLLATLIHAQSPSPKVRDRFIGVWKLVSCELKSANGDLTYPYGEQPIGRITYDKAGRMSATLMRP